MGGISLPLQGNSRQLPTENHANRSYVPPVGADPIIVTLAKGAQTDPQLLNLTNRVANGSPSKDELSRFQAVIDQITVETKHKGTLQVPSEVTSELMPKVSEANATSSYWSAAEVDNFPKLLRRYGTDWEGIAQYMTTKTATMVENFFNKQTHRGNRKWLSIVSKADLRIRKQKKGTKQQIPGS
ncbi:hypothetical protein INS49_004806 [Diaporthe citri]|uniref:uncharacterized protein n=1 Tax=Diaporthe citri TaxID=83186 RepID=UPI001C7FF8E0|nr:uncharacterized protein INS49_004806 [Diaporthe citri]KAG6354202.1 hypothetical protein INS49_004806 [Diaporthe citri]